MTDFIYMRECPICGNSESQHMGTRSDNIRVLQCTNCLMGYVEKYPARLDDYYDDAYYYQETTDGNIHSHPSYGDYDAVASVSLGWGTFLTPYLKSSGDILDVGCANGYFLKGLDPNLFNRYGIEVNQHMVEHCKAAGIQIIGTDICAKELAQEYGQKFDIITGFAVLEHIPDIKQALMNIKAMLMSSGIFLFEMPLISEQYPNDIWFRSSLEHIYYPTIKSIENLFQIIFGSKVIGQETYIKDYGCTYIGMIAQEEQAYHQLELLFNRFFSPVPELTDNANAPEEVASFKFLYDIVYAADIERTDDRVFAAIPLQRFSQVHFARLFSLWRRDIRGITALKNATRWLEEQRQRWQQIAQEQGDLFHQDMRNWQNAVHQEQQLVQELHAWNEQLEQAKLWLEQQRAAWQAKAELLASDVEKLQQAHDQLLLHDEQRLSRRLRRVSAHIRKQMSTRHEHNQE